jgi:hypothetical protein
MSDALRTYSTLASPVEGVFRGRSGVVSREPLKPLKPLRLAGRAVVDLAVAIAMLAMVPLLLVTLPKSSQWPSSKAITYEQSSLRRIESSRVYTVPVDRSILASIAGRSLFELQRTSELQSRSGPTFIPPNPNWVKLPIAHSMLAFQPAWSDLPNPFTILENSARGFSSEELAYLRDFSSQPIWREFDLVARAEAVDVIAGRFVSPLPRGVPWTAAYFSGASEIQNLGFAAMSRAAYHLAIGQRDSAEMILRSIISVGFKLIDNGPGLSSGGSLNLVGYVLADQQIGSQLVITGRDALERFYIITHDARASAMQYERLRSSYVASRNLPAPTPLTRQELLRIAADPSENRGVRFASLELLSISPCTSARDLLLGQRADVRDAFARAKRDFARFPSERAMLDRIQLNDPVDLTDDQNGSTLREFLVGASTIAGGAVHNSRFAACTAFLTRGRFDFWYR